MKFLILLISLNFSIFANNLEVSLSNVVSQDGQMAIAIFKNGEGYPKNAELAVYREFINMDELPLQLSLEEGEYAISVFQDLNSDRKLNKKMFGIPKEPFGFSNNPKLFMGPPKYKKVKIKVGKKLSKVDIELKYY